MIFRVVALFVTEYTGKKQHKHNFIGIVSRYRLPSDDLSEVIAEEVNATRAKDLFRGLHFPSTDSSSSLCATRPNIEDRSPVLLHQEAELARPPQALTIGVVPASLCRCELARLGEAEVVH